MPIRREAKDIQIDRCVDGDVMRAGGWSVYENKWLQSPEEIRGNAW